MGNDHWINLSAVVIARRGGLKSGSCLPAYSHSKGERVVSIGDVRGLPAKIIKIIQIINPWCNFIRELFTNCDIAFALFMRSKFVSGLLMLLNIRNSTSLFVLLVKSENETVPIAYLRQLHDIQKVSEAMQLLQFCCRDCDDKSDATSLIWPQRVEVEVRVEVEDKELFLCDIEFWIYLACADVFQSSRCGSKDVASICILFDLKVPVIFVVIPSITNRMMFGVEDSAV